jgi:hypothetical protein
MMMLVRAWRERGCRDALCSCPVTQDAASSSADRPLELHSNCPAQGMHRGFVSASQQQKKQGAWAGLVCLQVSPTATKKF